MATDPASLRLMRRLFGGMGACLIAYAAAIVWLGSVTVHGKHQSSTTTYSGQDALLWAAMYACFGVAMFAMFARKAAHAGIWMGLWMTGGIAAVLVPAFFK
jgi:hypothetical protein